MLTQDLAKKIRRIQITTHRIVNQVMAGQYQSAFRGRGMEFAEVREYTPGDDIRTIDWNVTARFGKPFVKQYIEERELTVLFLHDLSGSLHFGTRNRLKSDLAAEVSAVLAFSAIRNNDRVGCILFSDTIRTVIPPKKGAQHVLRVIRDILYTPPETHGTRIADALDYLNRIQKRRAVVFLVSDFFDSDYEKSLRLAARRHDLVAIVVEDPAEYDLPNAGWMTLRDTETNRIHTIDTSNRAVRTAWQNHMDTLRAERDHRLKRIGLDTLVVSTARSYDADLYRFLRNRARRIRT
ncbi:DUF58 domain-containing protein [bacterium]|nr:DUF58 domain-containing protein [candidate division CSSED10-310 bacterium]